MKNNNDRAVPSPTTVKAAPGRHRWPGPLAPFGGVPASVRRKVKGWFPGHAHSPYLPVFATLNGTRAAASMSCFTVKPFQQGLL